jgi:hypothetical protein
VRWCVVSSLLVLSFAIKRAYAQNHSGWWVQRTQLEKSLVSGGGKHLIIVRYGLDHISGNEWVFNHADIMTSPVIWARELPEISPLLARFRDRQIWLLDLKQDDSEPKLIPYPIERQ